MPIDPSGDVTIWLREVSGGDRRHADRLFPVLYGELRRLAQSHLARERSDHTLQATALVNEAYLRLVDQTSADWKSRAHFMAVASQAIRRILIDHARGRARAKRGGGDGKLPLEAALHVAGEMNDTALVDLDRALEKLARAHPENARVVTMRYFGGLTVDEIAEVEGSSRSTVERAWRFARAWLQRELEAGGAPGETES
jgi:RNA polymerase sigma factor (TIGR02999 family)